MKVSVIIPTYNSHGLLAETLLSVAAQTFPNWECIVVDDESTDNTRAVVEGFVARDGRFRYVWQKNAERCEARNHGLRLAQGEYVAFLDHDDLWEPSFLEETVAYLEAHPEAGLVFAYGRSFAAGGRNLEEISLPEPENPDIFGQIIRYCIFTPTNTLMRRAAVESVGGFRPQWVLAEDYDLWLRFGRRYPMHVLKRFLARYRSHEGNAVNQSAEWFFVQRRLIRELIVDPMLSPEHRAIAQRRWNELPKVYAKSLLRRFVVFPYSPPTIMLSWILSALRSSPTAVWEERWVFRVLLKRLLYRKSLRWSD
jgi:glycosyltransferase involved in cell wall biosynthesis